MRFREVFRFEVGYRFRSASTWIYAGILFLFGFWFFLATADAGPGAYINAPIRLSIVSVMVGLFGLLITAAIFGDAAVRDLEVGMDPLLFTSPLTKAEYLGGRFLAALAVNAVVLVAIPAGLMAATWQAGSSETVGPFRVVAFLQPILLFSLPNLVIMGTILFTIGMLARQVIPVYLGAIGIFIGHIVALNYFDAIKNPILATLADPSGIGAMQEMTKYWTEAERNTRLIGFPAVLLTNRGVWLGVVAVVLVLLHQRYRFSHPDGGGRRRTPKRVSSDPAPVSSIAVTVPRVTGTFGPGTRTRQTLAISRTSLEEIMGGRAFLVALGLAMGLSLLWGWNVGDTVFDTSVWPVTHLVAEVALSARNGPIVFLLLSIYAGEMVWKDRDARVAEIVDAAPVPEWVALLGRFLALVVILAVFQCVYLAAGILLQTVQGYHHLELGLYLRILFGLNLTNYALIAALAVTIHVLVNQKYLGHILVLLAVGSTAALPRLGLVNHHLLLYGTDPGWTYSDMNGFGPFVAPIVWFKLYWAAWALLLLVIGMLFWVRGREPGWRRRLGSAHARLVGPAARAAGLAAALILALGGFIFYNTNVLNRYLSGANAGRPQVEYEKRYKRYEDAVQPMIVAAELRVEIYPETPAVDLSGVYRLVNRSARAIDSVQVYLAPEVQSRKFAFDRGATAVLTDTEVGFWIYALAQPLRPGDSLQLTFDVTFRPRGFRNDGNPTEVVRNGSHFDRRWLPIIGYQSVFELTGAEARQRLGLDPRLPLAGSDDAEARRRRSLLRNEDLVQVTAVVGTEPDQTVLMAGVLRRSWTENGRRYFQYETGEPTGFGTTIYSARYAVVEDRWQGVSLRIYHHPDHLYVLDQTVRSMKASLEYYTREFGPYQGDQLSIVESPGYGGFGVAHPQLIGFAEDNFISHVKPGEIDQPFYGTAHEIAHQWWGGEVGGAVVRGHSFLTESLANYSAMMVMEKTFGPAVARRVYDFQMNRYFLGRAGQSREVPVLEVEDQAYIAYRRGALALYTLREFIGEEGVNRALRRYVDKYRDAGPPYPTSRDLYRELQAETPDSLRYLLVDWLERVTLWEVKAERARMEPTGNGEYRVTIDVTGKKLVADSAGNEAPVPMNDLVEIGVFGAGKDGERGEPLYLERHRIRSGPQTISVIVPREPARAGIDPYNKLIDRQREDNVVDVKTGSIPAPTDRLTE